jgi:hypothetical protein
MYDLLTSSVLFPASRSRCPRHPPSGCGCLTAALVHAVVFYVVQRYRLCSTSRGGASGWEVLVAVALKMFAAPAAPTMGGRR